MRSQTFKSREVSFPGREPKNHNIETAKTTLANVSSSSALIKTDPNGVVAMYNTAQIKNNIIINHKRI